MNDTKEKHETHTPGPWHVRLGEDYYHVHGEVQVALVENWTVEDPRGNARLIAAAPETYEMCKLLLPIMQSIADDGHIRRGASRKGEYADKLRKVLAKVEGGVG